MPEYGDRGLGRCHWMTNSLPLAYFWQPPPTPPPLPPTTHCLSPFHFPQHVRPLSPPHFETLQIIIIISKFYNNVNVITNIFIFFIIIVIMIILHVHPLPPPHFETLERGKGREGGCVSHWGKGGGSIREGGVLASIREEACIYSRVHSLSHTHILPQSARMYAYVCVCVCVCVFVFICMCTPLPNFCCLNIRPRPTPSASTCQNFWKVMAKET